MRDGENRGRRSVAHYNVAGGGGGGKGGGFPIRLSLCRQDKAESLSSLVLSFSLPRPGDLVAHELKVRLRGAGSTSSDDPRAR